jgi:hypothetical protein
VIESDDRIIAWTANSLGSDAIDGKLSEEDKANARLIAAAPDLLAALRKAADYMGKMAHPADVLEEARAAIAKSDEDQFNDD